MGLGAAWAGILLRWMFRYSEILARDARRKDFVRYIPRLPAFALVALAVLALSGCGRRGPLELPPEYQAQGAALKAQQDAELAKTAPRKATPGAPVPAPPPPIPPGVTGNRPPAQYPFPLDPLL
jgi:predicted small lipoprotein YifL